MRTPTTALLLVAAYAATAAARAPLPDKPEKGPLTLTLKADKARYAPGDLVTLTLTLTNTSDKPLDLDVKPVKFLNTGHNALATGELLRRYDIRDGEPRLSEPKLVEYGGIEPGVTVKDNAVKLAPGEVKTVKMVAVAEALADGGRLLFDDPNSPGLKAFGKRLSRSVWSFTTRSAGDVTLRAVYDRGGVKAASEDVKVEIEKK